MASEGHVIGDHSYDHMFHNSRNSPRNAYQVKDNPHSHKCL